MLKKSLLLLPLVAALFTASLPAQAAEYHVVVPAPGKAEPYAAIKVELRQASLPDGRINKLFEGFDFNSALGITGDPELDMSQVAWSVSSGSLPSGLSLTRSGSLYGTPTEQGEASFQLRAKYKTKAALGTYQISVSTEKYLVNTAGVRTWEDGTVAQSCSEYRQPTYPYVYAGDTGDGIYRIAPEGIEPFDVRCDMSTEGGGWTLVEYTQDLAFKAWFPAETDLFRWLPSNFNLRLSDAQVNAIREVSTVARQRYIGLCEGVLHYYMQSGATYGFSVGFRYHTGLETNHGFSTYSPATVQIVQDGCKANGGEGGRVERATIFDIENINLPITNIGTIDNSGSSEQFGAPLTQYPARFR